MPVGSIIHPAPTNIINSVKGWNTRHIYNYYGTSNYTDFNYVTESSGDYSQNLFKVIEDYTSAGVNTIYKGGYTFPPRYFRAGKDLRIKTFLFVDTDTYDDALLQINIGIDNTKISYRVIGATNKGFAHEFGAGSQRSAFLEVEIVCRGIEAQNKPLTLNMMATGYVRYNVAKLDRIDTNDANYLIPIVPTSTTLITIDNDLLSAVENTLNLNFDGSFHIPTINVLNLSIEELE
jgi:hypothetical protein